MLRSLQENKPEGHGVREFIAILKLHQTHSSEVIKKAVDAAVESGMLGLDRVMYQLHRLLLPVPHTDPIDLTNLPQLAKVGCQSVDLSIYDQLVRVR